MPTLHLFKIGVDAWWLDTTEPETEDRETNILVTNKTYLGSGARYANAFPLMTTGAVYQGQRKESDQKRVFILSRSAFAGSQRNAAAVWSTSNRHSLRPDKCVCTYVQNFTRAVLLVVLRGTTH